MNKHKFPQNATAKQVYDLLVKYTSDLDFRDANDVNRYKKVLLIYFTGIKSFRIEIAGTLTRARINDGPNTFFKNVKEMKYPPLHLARISRANAQGEPIFYCSDDPGTTIFEVRPQNLGDWITTIEVGFMEKVINLLVLGIELEDRLSAKLTEVEKGVHMFLREKFSGKFEDECHLYHLTLSFVNLYMGDKHGVMYPSVASNLKGRNIALKTDFIDEFAKFGIATIHEVTAIKSECEIDVKCIFRSYGLDDNEDFVWEAVNDCTGHSIDESIYD